MRNGLRASSTDGKILIKGFGYSNGDQMTECYQVERQMGKLVPFLNLKMKDGSSLGVPYSLIMQVHLFSEAEMLIRLGQLDVTIEGSGLGVIHDYLLQQRLVEVCEILFKENINAISTHVRSIRLSDS